MNCAISIKRNNVDFESISAWFWMLKQTTGVQEMMTDSQHLLVDDVSEASDIVNVYLTVKDKSELDKICSSFKDQFTGITLSSNELSDTDYLDEYKKNVPDTFIESAKIWIGAPWKKIPEDTNLNLIINPAQSFGTGEHPSTQMCLELLYDLHQKNEVKITSFLDIGAGSGVLGIATKKLFPKSELIMTERDPICKQDILDNFALNETKVLKNQILIDDGEVFDSWIQKKVEFDCVLSNIYAEVLADMAPQIHKLLKDKGYWVMSGILDGEPSEKLKKTIEPHFRLVKMLKITQDMSITGTPDTWHGWLAQKK